MIDWDKVNPKHYEGIDEETIKRIYQDAYRDIRLGRVKDLHHEFKCMFWEEILPTGLAMGITIATVVIIMIVAILIIRSIVI